MRKIRSVQKSLWNNPFLNKTFQTLLLAFFKLKEGFCSFCTSFLSGQNKNTGSPLLHCLSCTGDGRFHPWDRCTKHQKETRSSCEQNQQTGPLPASRPVPGAFRGTPSPAGALLPEAPSGPVSGDGRFRGPFLSFGRPGWTCISSSLMLPAMSLWMSGGISGMMPLWHR